MTQSPGPSPIAAFVRAPRPTAGEVLPRPAELLSEEHTLLRYVDLDGIMQTLDYGDLALEDPMPVPMPVDREDYNDVETSLSYWAGGHTDWLNVREALDRYATVDRESRLRLLDFGCASGRFLRHASLFGGLETWGCDLSPEHIAWITEHLAAELKVFLNTDLPHLPFADGYFDIVTAFSVLTHIDLLETAWLLELRRITNPQGLLYITVQNEATWNKVQETEDPTMHLPRIAGVQQEIEPTETLFREPMPRDRIMFRMSANDVYNCNVWMTNDYIRANWSRYFEIIDIVDHAHLEFQSVVIMRPLP